MGILKNRKAAGKDEVTGDIVVDWIWRLYNMAFDSGEVLEDNISAVIVPVYKGKGED